MRIILRAVPWLLALLVAGLATPASAQVPVPYIYDEIIGGWGLRLASRDKPAEQIAAEQAAADLAETRCNAGDIPGCAKLGLAYLHGEGRPQNRPVAELLLRQSCDAAAAEGCLGLGLLLRSIEEPGPRTDGTMALGRGCRLGSLDACNEEADAVAAGTNGQDRDQDRANILRRAACDRGGTTACRELGSTLAWSDNPAMREEGIGMLEGLCRSGDARACNFVVYRLQQIDPQPAQRLQAMTDAGCKAGEANLCNELGYIEFAAASGLPENRTAALAAYDRACAIQASYCDLPAKIRSRPVLEASCGRGVRSDCIALGRLYSADHALLAFPDEATRLLGRACDEGATEACGDAVRALGRADPAVQREYQDRIATWLDKGCQGGVDNDCDVLGNRLLAGEPTPEDRERGYALLQLACGRGSLTTCENLDMHAMADPAAPILSVDWRYRPPVTPEEEAEVRRLKDEADARAEAERCHVSEVSFRGSVWQDTLCEPRGRAVIKGRRALRGEAPWQALFWRPELFNGQRIDPSQQVECGGALVREGWVLTAAHCVVDKKKRLTLTPGHTVRLGVYEARDLQGESYGISQVFVHPDYHEKARVFDIALVRLNTSRRVRRGTVGEIRTIPFDDTPLEQRVIRAGIPVFVYGWGLTAFEGTSSNRLKAAELKTEAASDCEKRTKTDDGFLKSVLICAKADDGSQACNGDSGGPLVRYEQAGQRSPVVIGVVSAGTNCGETGVGTRYTRVGKVTDWIARVLRGVERPVAPPARR